MTALTALPIGISVLALVLSVANFATARRSQAQARTALLNQLRGEWGDLAPKWRITLAAARTTIDAYVNLTVDERRRLIAATFVLEPDAEELSGLNQSAFKHDDTEVLEALRDSFSRDEAVRGEYYAAFGAVLEFLVLSADLLISGRLGPREVYVLFGNDVARHGAAIRAVAGTSDLGPGAEVPSRVKHYPLGFGWPGPGRKERILFLLDAMWAELARRGDLDPHNLVKVARLKEDGSGLECRRRSLRLMLEDGGRWRGQRPALRMQRHLMHAEMLSTASMRGQAMTLVYERDEELVRLGIWWRIRYIRKFMQGLERVPVQIEFSTPME